ncbi:P-loop containing nucleoside triphosphate hydrolase protein [Sistotremastrum suecicum HHB10207 ss-3]|uniref:p-loop containing nucleoside triphosphate hydrolase protein n=1 Tax=Sistotremastrum suecicum HHB10207 ss-3 TaxID=1314776 RepID=A0A166IBY1_9AGAM|nr:P-loop containing nucleoside triphosphate hydrolase protein [Sistotremastrum suecicum HHB10207 ss-3]
MYHLLKGFREYMTRKEEFSIVIIGMDGAGKTTLLENIKTTYNPVPGLPPNKITPTVGQNTGRITLPSTILQFIDLGGQSGIRTIWDRYYDGADALAYVVDASDIDRLNECWEVFDNVLASPKILGIPLLLLANKQDDPTSLSVEQIRSSYEEWWQNRLNTLQRSSGSSDQSSRSASLDVMGISALHGNGVRDAVNWLFLRVQNSRARYVIDFARFLSVSRNI